MRLYMQKCKKLDWKSFNHKMLFFILSFTIQLNSDTKLERMEINEAFS